MRKPASWGTVGSVAGTPIGLKLRADYRPEAIQIEPNDIFVAFSRGLTEARNGKGERFGVDGVDRGILKSNDGSADAVRSSILDSLAEFREEQQQQEDVTLVVVRRAG